MRAYNYAGFLSPLNAAPETPRRFSGAIEASSRDVVLQHYPGAEGTKPLLLQQKVPLRPRFNELPPRNGL